MKRLLIQRQVEFERAGASFVACAFALLAAYQNDIEGWRPQLKNKNSVYVSVA
jgi:hypothetical protein